MLTTIPPLHAGPLQELERLATLDRVDELLELRHRSADLGNFEDPLEESVYIILSKQTRQAVYQRAHEQLRARWPTWRSLLEAPVDDVADVIKPAGFGPTRAILIHNLLSAVDIECQRRGIKEITLDWLRDLDETDVESALSALPGIGPKSARCVMHYSLGLDAFAVDTHVGRILHRLGIVQQRPGKVRHADYETAVPPRIRQRLHVNLVHHGRAYCRSAKPLCGDCPLISFCPTGRELAGKVDDPRPVAVELFAGGGGLGEGFTRAGYRVAVAVELDRAAAQSYRINHPGTVVLEADATKVTGKQLAELTPPASSPQVIIAGPPCQGYSIAGKRKADDAKNVLYKAVTDLARDLAPDFIAIENVPGMRRVEGRSFEATVLDDLREAGYVAEAHLLRACDFGVPQLRRRLLFLGERSTEEAPVMAPAAPDATHCAGSRCIDGCGGEADRQGVGRCGRPLTPNVLASLAGLPPLAHGQEAEHRPLPDGKVLLNGSTMRHSQAVLDKLRGIRAGAGPISYRRLHTDLARTIVAGHRALPVHPTLDRTISVREAARIQGFDDEHVFAGRRSQQPLQVANAVPPPLAQAVANTLSDAARLRYSIAAEGQIKRAAP